MKNLSVLVEDNYIRGVLNKSTIWKFNKTNYNCYVFSETNLSTSNIIAVFRLIPKEK